MTAATVRCTLCGLMIEYSLEKLAMVDISGAAYCVDLEPHRPDTAGPCLGDYGRYRPPEHAQGLAVDMRLPLEPPP
jgi:hypothetical protein